MQMSFNLIDINFERVYLTFNDAAFKVYSAIESDPSITVQHFMNCSSEKKNTTNRLRSSGVKLWVDPPPNRVAQVRPTGGVIRQNKGAVHCTKQWHRSKDSNRCQFMASIAGDKKPTRIEPHPDPPPHLPRTCSPTNHNLQH